MNTNFRIIAISILIYACAGACKNNPSETQSDKVFVSKDISMIEVNKILIGKDKERIKHYIERRNWDMQETATGLWYFKYETGNGQKAMKGKTAVIDYTVELLDGTKCYSSKDGKPKSFKIGQGGVEAGLEQGILLLKEGDKAKFILPPHLAYGLLGDNDKIPPRAILVYDVNLIKIQ